MCLISLHRSTISVLSTFDLYKTKNQRLTPYPIAVFLAATDTCMCAFAHSRPGIPEHCPKQIDWANSTAVSAKTPAAHQSAQHEPERHARHIRCPHVSSSVEFVALAGKNNGLMKRAMRVIDVDWPASCVMWWASHSACMQHTHHTPHELG